MSGARLAVDIGGTFTDLALEHDGRRHTAKVLTTQAEPETGVMQGIAAILTASGLEPSDIALVIHGTTLATNAIIERKGAVTALVTTEGFRDVLALRNESRYEQYDLNIVLPEPLVPRHLRLTVPERTDNEGKVRLKLDEQAVHALVPVLRRERVESLAIGYMHGFVNPAHEQRTRDILAAALPDLPISLASEVSPEMREWERFSTTVANAYVQPLIGRYLRRLAMQLREAGLHGPLFLLLSGGGISTVETACRFPIRLVESGPAGGAIFAADVARKAGLASVLSFDMGGTTAKICLLDDYTPQTARAFEVARVGRFRKGSGLPLRVPVIDMVEIGAGGGSLARVDALGLITVGPDSAGADPGPVCYGRGGTIPAVTDANLLLGRYDPNDFAGGTMVLDETAARVALQTGVAAAAGLNTQVAALGVVELVDENMANAARSHAIESGKTLEGRTLIAFGGGGPVHAARLAEKLGIERVLIPAGAGVGSAIGFLRAPIAYEVVRSLYQRLGRFDLATVNAMLDTMAAEAEAVVAQASFGRAPRQERLAYMRYLGQGHEIAVPLPPRKLEAADIETLRRDYEGEYARLYDRTVPGADIEVLSYAVRVATPNDGDIGVREIAATTQAAPHGHRPVRDIATGELSDWAILRRDQLTPGVRLAGPAILAEPETSTLVGPGWSARRDAHGGLHLQRESRP